MSEYRLARLVPPDPPDKRGGSYSAQGTKVVLPDGSALPGVRKVVVTVEADDVWRAEIHCFIEPTELPLFYEQITRHTPPVEGVVRRNGNLEFNLDLTDLSTEGWRTLKAIPVRVMPPRATEPE